MSTSPLLPLITALPQSRRNGDEPFHDVGRTLGFTVGDFWSWSSSDLLSNALRGRVAEFLVAKALGVDEGVRNEWDAFDLTSKTGVTIEVKSSAYVQSWAQRGPSRPSFGIAPTRAWSAETNEYSGTARRQAQVYVFALLHHQDRYTIDPLDVNQWEFFVVPTALLDQRMPAQKTIGFAGLLGLSPRRCRFEELAEAVEEAARSADPQRSSISGDENAD